MDILFTIHLVSLWEIFLCFFRLLTLVQIGFLLSFKEVTNLWKFRSALPYYSWSCYNFWQLTAMRCLFLFCVSQPFSGIKALPFVPWILVLIPQFLFCHIFHGSKHQESRNIYLRFYLQYLLTLLILFFCNPHYFEFPQSSYWLSHFSPGEWLQFDSFV